MTRPRRAITPEQREARLAQMARDHAELPVPPGTGPLTRQAKIDHLAADEDRRAYEAEVAADKETDEAVRLYGLGGA